MFRLDLELPVPTAIRAAATHELGDAVGRMRETDGAEARSAAIHSARKDLKKVRSLLRLCRSALPGRVYRRESRRLREIQASVSSVRDAAVLVGTVESLRERFVGRLPEGAFEQLRRVLSEDAARALGSDWRTKSSQLAAELESSCRSVRDWPVDDCDLHTLLDGATRSYRRGRRAYKAAEKHGSTEAFHELRKRVKDQWHHSSLLSDAWPVALKARAKAAHELSDLLGDDHDLAVLAEVIASPTSPQPIFEDDLEEFIEERRHELQTQALRIAERLYAEKPKAYRRRLGSYLGAVAAGDRVPA